MENALSLVEKYFRATPRQRKKVWIIFFYNLIWIWSSWTETNYLNIRTARTDSICQNYPILELLAKKNISLKKFQKQIHVL